MLMKIWKLMIKCWILWLKLNTKFLSFFNDLSKTAILNRIITSPKAIYNLFGSGIYHKSHYALKPKQYGFHNRNIGLFNWTDSSTGGHFVGMHIDLLMRKFRGMTTNSKLSKVVSYIHDSNLRRGSMFFSNTFYLCWFLKMSDSNQAIMDNV